MATRNTNAETSDRTSPITDQVSECASPLTLAGSTLDLTVSGIFQLAPHVAWSEASSKQLETPQLPPSVLSPFGNTQKW